jgi:hypothetical protein
MWEQGSSRRTSVLDEPDGGFLATRLGGKTWPCLLAPDAVAAAESV